MRYLQAVSRCVPEAIDELVSIAPGDEERLLSWAVDRGFTDHWALEAARQHATIWREHPAERGRWVMVAVAAWVPAYGTASAERTPGHIGHLKAVREHLVLQMDDMMAHASAPLGANDGERFDRMAAVVRGVDEELARPWSAPAPAWDPLNETEASYRRRVDAYVEALKTAPGVERTPEKAADEQHFEWLALHHADCWTYAQIAEKYGGEHGIEIGSISEAIGSLAKIVGLTLRPRPGRPGRKSG